MIISKYHFLQLDFLKKKCLSDKDFIFYSVTGGGVSWGPDSGDFPFSLFYKFIYLIYLFLAVLGLPCCAWAFSSCGEWGLLFVAVRELLIAVASLVAEHEL